MSVVAFVARKRYAEAIAAINALDEGAESEETNRVVTEGDPQNQLAVLFGDDITSDKGDPICTTLSAFRRYLIDEADDIIARNTVLPAVDRVLEERSARLEALELTHMNNEMRHNPLLVPMTTTTTGGHHYQFKPRYALFTNEDTRTVHKEYKRLNEEQKTVCEGLLRGMSAKSTEGGLYVLNAPPGTGKSHLIGVMTRILRPGSAIFVVYQRNLKYIMENATQNLLECMTTCSFFMRLLKYPRFSVYSFLMRGSKEDLCTEMKSLLEKEDVVRFMEHLSASRVLLIIDEYTVTSSWQLLFLIVACKRFGVNIFLVGDALQQPPIKKTIHHGNCGNFALLEACSPEAVFSLRTNMRIRDESYAGFLQAFTGFLERRGCMKRAFDINAPIMWELFRLREKHFFMQPAATDVLIAEHHARLRDKYTNLLSYLRKDDPTGRYHTICPFLYGATPKDCKPRGRLNPHVHKFVDEIVYVSGLQYMWVRNDGRRSIVRFISMCDADNRSARFETEREGPVTLTLAPLNHFMFPDEKYTYYRSLRPDEKGDIFLIPAIPFTEMTFASAQGLTLSLPSADGDVDGRFRYRSRTVNLCLDKASGNAMYVGISRVISGDSLGAIVTSKLVDLIVTRLFACRERGPRWADSCHPTYYYHLSATHNPALYALILKKVHERGGDVQWWYSYLKDAVTDSLFRCVTRARFDKMDSSTPSCRVASSCYDSDLAPTPDTELMAVARTLLAEEQLAATTLRQSTRKRKREDDELSDDFIFG